jgi:hypothetical protein
MSAASWIRGSVRTRTRPLFASILACIGMSGALLLSGCGSGSSSMANNNNTGMALITVTDAAGDFQNYIVNVSSLQLTRSDGTVVETVSTATKVDFVQLVDLSEIISAAQVPGGKYVGVALTLDYSGAVINVDNGSGGSITVSNTTCGASTAGLQCAIYNGMTTTPVSAPVKIMLQLPPDKPLVITAGNVANLALDFNLAAGNTLVMPGTTTPITSWTGVTSAAVEVLGTLSASLMPDTTKQLHVRGPLDSVDTTKFTYTIDVRPFYNSSGTHGQFVVATTSTTTFSINGKPYTSQATAFDALQSALSSGPLLTSAYGTFDVASKTFTASQVLAGTSVPGAGLDSLEGTVIARSGNTLTISRGLICHHDDDDQEVEHHTIMAAVSSSTTVTADGQSGPFDTTSISVGQHLQLFGTFNANSSPQFTASYARLMLTPLWGSNASVSNSTNIVTLQLQSLDNLKASVFDFTGTGVSGSDATVSAYTVGVPPILPTTGLNGLPVRFRGFVTPFGMANNTSSPPVPDFSAVTLVNFANTEAQLLLGWMPPAASNMPFSSLSSSSTSLVLNSASLQSATFSALRIGPQRTSLSALSSLTIVPDSTASAPRFGIAHLHGEDIDSYSTFADLVTALYGDLNGTMTTVLGVFAEGTYAQDTTTNTATLTADHVFIALDD